MATQVIGSLQDPALPPEVLAEMERLNAEAAPLHIWLRTRANAPLQPPWDRPGPEGAEKPIPEAGVPESRTGRAVPHLWKWGEIEPYLHRIAEIAPLEFTDRQQFLLTNPGFGGVLKIANTIRIAVSIYKPGDVAETHVHTPNASRTILSEQGGYTTIGRERCEARRGDLILTPNGSWHGHGNDSDEPVIWIDVLDWPLLDFLDAIWIDTDEGKRANAAPDMSGRSGRLYGAGGLVPRIGDAGGGTGEIGMVHHRGSDMRAALDNMRDMEASPYDGVTVDVVDPMTGGPRIKTLGYSAHLLKPGQQTHPLRESASTVYTVMEGSGWTEVNGKRFDWSKNDILVVPSHMWRTHCNTDGDTDAVLYAVSDAPLLRAIGQFRRQGRTPDGALVEL